MQKHAADTNLKNHMSFASPTSQAHTKATVNKLLASFVPGTAVEATLITPTPHHTKPSSAKAEIAAKIIAIKHNPEEARRIAAARKRNQHKKILKATAEAKKFDKLAKYNIIKAHKADGTMTPEEEKYLQKLVKKNVSAVNSLSEIDNDEVKAELALVKRDILAATGPKPKRSKKLNSKQKEFNTKVKRGFISYPGLTPGLAPIDHNESDSE